TDARQFPHPRAMQAVEPRAISFSLRNRSNLGPKPTEDMIYDFVHEQIRENHCRCGTAAACIPGFGGANPCPTAAASADHAAVAAADSRSRSDDEPDFGN